MTGNGKWFVNHFDKFNIMSIKIALWKVGKKLGGKKSKFHRGEGNYTPTRSGKKVSHYLRSSNLVGIRIPNLGNRPFLGSLFLGPKGYFQPCGTWPWLQMGYGLQSRLSYLYLQPSFFFYDMNTVSKPTATITCILYSHLACDGSTMLI